MQKSRSGDALSPQHNLRFLWERVDLIDVKEFSEVRGKPHASPR
jgi:hypothetical protein